ncbi:Desmocollin-2 [Manis javanica]|nr:Desmocollin-2 [Manis javanica]
MDENRTLTRFYGSNKEPRRGQRSGDRRGQKEHGIKQYKGRDPLGWGSEHRNLGSQCIHMPGGEMKILSRRNDDQNT